MELSIRGIKKKFSAIKKELSNLVLVYKENNDTRYADAKIILKNFGKIKEEFLRKLNYIKTYSFSQEDYTDVYVEGRRNYEIGFIFAKHLAGYEDERECPLLCDSELAACIKNLPHTENNKSLFISLLERHLNSKFFGDAELYECWFKLSKNKNNNTLFQIVSWLDAHFDYMQGVNESKNISEFIAKNFTISSIEEEKRQDAKQLEKIFYNYGDKSLYAFIHNSLSNFQFVMDYCGEFLKKYEFHLDQIKKVFTEHSDDALWRNAFLTRPQFLSSLPLEMYRKILSREKIENLPPDILVDCWDKVNKHGKITFAELLFDKIVHIKSKLFNWEKSFLIEGIENVSKEKNRFSKEEFRNFKIEKILSLGKHYQKYGLIDKDTFDSVVLIAKKYNKNITEETLLAKLTNENLNSVLKGLSLCCDCSSVLSDGKTKYDQEIKGFETIYSKTRMNEMISWNAFERMPIQMKEKFDVKVWRELTSYPLCRYSEDIGDTSEALIELIAVMGLFEKDDAWQERLNKTREMFQSAYLINESMLNCYFGLLKKILKKTNDTVKIYSARPLVEIPEDFERFFKSDGRALSEDRIKSFKTGRGTFYKELNDWLSPYVQEKDGFYRLKNGVAVPKEFKNILKGKLSESLYNNLILKDNRIAKFLNPIQEQEFAVYRLKDDLSTQDIQEIYKMNIIGESYFGKESLHCIFDGCEKKYDKEFYRFFVDNFNIIMGDEELMSEVSLMQKKFKEAKKYYLSKGNADMNIWDLRAFNKEEVFDYEFGYNKFASQVSKAGVTTQKDYDLYFELFKRMQERKSSSIPRLDNTYSVKIGGRNYTTQAQILRLDDPLSLLVGEASFTNCCQSIGGAGEACMIHSATNKHGGVLVTYLIDESGNKKMLTQSWIWRNNNALCLDNVEGTKLVKGDRQLMKVARETLFYAAKDLIKNGNAEVEKYVGKRIEKLTAQGKMDGETNEKIKQLKQLREKQMIGLVSAGIKYDDIELTERFPKLYSAPSPYVYSSYTDSSSQVEIIRSESYNEFLGEPLDIYRDNRRLTHLKGRKISQAEILKVWQIQKEAYPNYIENFWGGEKSDQDIEEIAEYYDAEVDQINMLLAEDWCMIYIDREKEIEITEFACKQARFKDERKVQQEEMYKAFMCVLKSSVTGGQRKITAKCFENQAYLIYLFLKKKGIIVEIENDIRQDLYGNNSVNMSTTDQEKYIKDFSKIMREDKNEFIHKVCFLPSKTTLQKLLHSRMIECENEREKD